MSNQNTKMDQNIKEQLLNAWHDSIVLFNKTHSIAVAMPNDKLELADKIKKSSFDAMERIAQTANSEATNELQNHIINASEAVYSTIATLYICRQWGIVNKYAYEETSALAKNLTQLLFNLSEQNNSIGSVQ